MGDRCHTSSPSTLTEFNHLIIAHYSVVLIVPTEPPKSANKHTNSGIFVRKSITNADSVLIIFIHLIWNGYATQLIRFALLTMRCKHTPHFVGFSFRFFFRLFFVNIFIFLRLVESVLCTKLSSNKYVYVRCVCVQCKPTRCVRRTQANT